MDDCNSMLTKNIYFEKKMHFQHFRKCARKSKFKGLCFWKDYAFPSSTVNCSLRDFKYVWT